MILQMLQEAVTGQHFDWVILDKAGQGWSPYYLILKELYEPSDPFYPVTGAPSRPELLLVKNPVVYGGAYPLGDRTYNPFFTQGWEEPSGGGRQAVGPSSVLQVALEGDRAYQIQFEAQPNCPAGRGAPSSLTIDWNEERLGEVRFASCARAAGSVDLPASAIRPGMNELNFAIQPIPTAPSENAANAAQPVFTLTSLVFTPK
jgi:hypothetical protein